MTKPVVVSLAQRDWADAVADVDGLDAVVWDMSDAPPRDDIQLVVPPYIGAGKVLHRLTELPHLEAVQLVTAGYEHAVEHLPAGVRLANGRGIHDTSTAELAVGLTIASQRGLDLAARAQQDHHWVDLNGRPSLADSRVLLVGYGSIGRAIAARLAPFEVTVTAVASRARTGDEFVDRVHAIDDVHSLLPESDVVILILPLTDSTAGLVDGEFLAALPDDALVVNVARGGIVDTGALLTECRTGRLRAALDVTDPEPLPDGHPLWTAPGVLITPHVGGATTAFDSRARRFLRGQIESFVRNCTLNNVVVDGA